jgi:4-amino-4-deoxy-L-arabinose transferase-like glycosyltransferase
MELETIIFLVLLVMFGPPVLFMILGAVKRTSNKETSKIFFVLAAVWLLVGGGICASIMS